MTVSVINTDEVGLGLELADGMIKAKVDPSAGNALTVSNDGLKVIVPEQQDVPVAYADSVINDHTITFTKTDGSTDELVLPATPVDVHVNGLEFKEDGTLEITLEGGQKQTTNLTGEIIGKALLKAPEAVKADLATMFAPLILDKIKGDKLLRVNGNTLGYLLAESVV